MATWFHVFESLPWPDITECLQEHALLFTDGSTMQHSVVPRSSWSVVLAFPRSHNFEVLFADVLPGKQCNYRAELFAVLVTVQCAVTADVFSDNLGVVQGFSLLLKHGWVADRFLQQAEARSKFAVTISPNSYISVYHFAPSTIHHCTTKYSFTTSPPQPFTTLPRNIHLPLSSPHPITTLPRNIHLPPRHLKQSPYIRTTKELPDE